MQLSSVATTTTTGTIAVQTTVATTIIGTARPRIKTSSTRLIDTRRCQICGVHGHSAGRCSQLQLQGTYGGSNQSSVSSIPLWQPRANVAAAQMYNANNWLFDSGATHHLTLDLNNLALHQPSQPVPATSSTLSSHHSPAPSPPSSPQPQVPTTTTIPTNPETNPNTNPRLFIHCMLVYASYKMFPYSEPRFCGTSLFKSNSLLVVQKRCMFLLKMFSEVCNFL